MHFVKGQDQASSSGNSSLGDGIGSREPPASSYPKQPNRRRFIGLAAAVPAVSLLGGCAGLDRGPPPPPTLADQVTVLGIRNARFWPDTQGQALVAEAIEALRRERAATAQPLGGYGDLSPAHFLALSGGGDDGAFGAGLLCGWSDAGTIPSFKLVTGVSTGAMIAPLAFLGRPYNERLRALFTTIGPEHILEKRGLFCVLMFPGGVSQCLVTDPIARLSVTRDQHLTAWRIASLSLRARIQTTRERIAIPGRRRSCVLGSD